MGDITKKLLLAYKSLPDHGAASIRQMVARDPSLSVPEGFDQSQFDPERFEIKTGKGFILRTLLQSMETLAGAIESMEWTFVHASANRPFISSDTPVTVINMDARGTMFEEGLGYEGGTHFSDYTHGCSHCVMEERELPQPRTSRCKRQADL